MVCPRWVKRERRIHGRKGGEIWKDEMWKPNLVIEKIDDVLPHLTEGIQVKERDGYTVIDYTYAGPETFSNPMACECRGLKFAPDGELIARPLHKFFNLGERVERSEIDWSARHTIYEKLDGSMVHSCVLDGQYVLMTRGGVSPQAIAAEACMTGQHWELVEDLHSEGKTAVFEFTSPENRIVVPYTDSAVTFIGARDMLTGEYLTFSAHRDIENRYGISVAQSEGCVDDAERFIAGARSLIGCEGYVIAFEDGNRLKIKGDDYVIRHTALATIGSEKRVLSMVLDGSQDDVLPILPANIAERLTKYTALVNGQIDAIKRDIEGFVERHKSLPRKEFAEKVKTSIAKQFMGAAFGGLDDKSVRDAVAEAVRRASRSQAGMDAMRPVFTPKWSIDDLKVTGGIDD